jgi:Ca2+-binding RTX toxin-like protein
MLEFSQTSMASGGEYFSVSIAAGVANAGDSLIDQFHVLSDTVGMTYDESLHSVSEAMAQLAVSLSALDKQVLQAFWDLTFGLGRAYDAVGESVSSLFFGAQRVIQWFDPLTLDLDGDGIETVPPNPDSPILFDHTGEGLKTGTGWIKADDGLLVLDRDGNGQIDNGTELFGDSTPIYGPEGEVIGKAEDGFHALGQEDSNADGVIDSLDAHWGELRVWQDINQDGESQEGELRTMEQAGIASINALKIEHSRLLPGGNEIADLGTFLRTDGTTGTAGTTSGMADVNLAADTFHRAFAEAIAITPAAAVLPNMHGSGIVRDLREAVSLSTGHSQALTSLLDQYAQAGTRAEQLGLLDALVMAWGATSGMEGMETRASEHGYSFSSNLDPTRTAQLTALEQFNGRSFFRFPWETQPGQNAMTGMTLYTDSEGRPAIRIAMNGNQLGLLDQAWQALRQSVYDGLLLQTRLQPYVDAMGLLLNEEGVRLNFSGVEQAFQAHFETAPGEAVRDLLDLQRIAGNTLAGSGWDGYTLLRDWLAAPLDASIRPALADFGYSGLSANGAGSLGNDVVLATEESLPLAGNYGNDLVLGGTGNDQLHGGAGRDVLAGGAGSDTYRFHLGDGHDVLIETHGDVDSDSLQFGSGISTAELGISVDGGTLVFAHANGQDRLGIANWFDSLAPDAHRLDRVGFADGRTFGLQAIQLGGSAGESLRGTATDDILHGQAGDDDLQGGGGNDWLDGGSGADTMAGGEGDDTYVLDHAEDTIVEAAEAGLDTVEAKLSTALGEHLENLVLVGNGALHGAGNQLANVITGNAGNNVLQGLAGNDTLQGGAGNDRLDGGEGADVMAGGAGDDAYVVDAQGDVTIELSGAGMDHVQSQLTWTLADHVEHLTLVGDDVIDGMGNELANTLIGNTASNRLWGMAGDDRLDGGAGADDLAGGEGNDTYVVDSLDDRTLEAAGQGTDHVQAGLTWSLAGEVEHLSLTGADAIDGTGNTLDNRIVGNAAANTLLGLAGDDILDGSGGADVLIGGSGNDGYVVDNAFDQIVELADEGVDGVASSVSWGLGSHLENLTLIGMSAIDGTGNELANVTTGNGAANALLGLAGDDRLLGEGGNDILDGGSGDDVMAGGRGDDSYYVDSLRDVTQESAGAGSDTVYSTLNWTLAENVETLVLLDTSALDGTGNGLANRLVGNGSSNRLYGLAGDDWLDGGMAEDVLAGGTGNDTYVADLPGDKVVEYANEGTDTVLAAMNFTLREHVENLTLVGERNSQGRGNDLANILSGNQGDNVLEGRAGNDILSGGAGIDRLEGGVGDDVYRFGRGSGWDTIVESSEIGNNDQLHFGEGISIDQLWFRQVGGDLEVGVLGGDDRVRIAGWYEDVSRRVESFQTADGGRLLDGQVQALVDAMAGFSPPAPGETQLPTAYREGLAPVLAANWQ